MPIYEYIHTTQEDTDNCSLGFELIQNINDDPLTACPKCGKPCKKKFSSFKANNAANNVLTKSNLEKHGFTQFKRKGKGYYEKTAGKGPAGFAGESK